MIYYSTKNPRCTLHRGTLKKFKFEQKSKYSWSDSWTDLGISKVIPVDILDPSEMVELEDGTDMETIS